MACGSCGGNRSGVTSEWIVTVGGVQQPERFVSVQAARIWIGQNVSGVAAQIKAVPKAAS